MVTLIVSWWGVSFFLEKGFICVALAVLKLTLVLTSLKPAWPYKALSQDTKRKKRKPKEVRCQITVQRLLISDLVLI